MSGSIKRLFIIVILAVISLLLLQRILFVEINEEKYCILSSKMIISGHIGKTDINKLSNFKRLKYLAVSTIEQDISFVKDHKEPEQLYLCIVDIDDKGTDHTPLNSCKKIEELGLTCNNADGAVISNMKELRKLVLNTRRITDSSLLWECSSLESADIRVPDEGLSLKGIGNLDKLNYIYLSGEGEVTDADELCKCNDLTELGIVCEIENTSFLTSLPNLEKLYIDKSLIDQDTINMLEDKNIEITFY